MEQIQQAYVTAVASTVGATVEFMRVDMYRIDCEVIRQPDQQLEETSIKFQLKATTQDSDPGSQSSEAIPFQFQNRSQLNAMTMERRLQKLILVLMVLPSSQLRWTGSTETFLALRHACYWVNLEGETFDASVETPTIHVPRANRLTPVTLSGLLDRAERGERL